MWKSKFLLAKLKVRFHVSNLENPKFVAVAQSSASIFVVLHGDPAPQKLTLGVAKKPSGGQTY